MNTRLQLVMFLLATCFSANAQYISNVIEYTPAPGQYINALPFGAPHVAAQSVIGGVSGSMCLGAFGGYVVFRFANPVENHPDNPYGVDFTIFGNPQKAYGYERVTWSEPGAVYVMKDANGNGLPDDTWYELAGSDYYFSTTIKGYSVTYTNPNQSVAADVPWTDNRGNSGAVMANSFHQQPYYPLADSFPHISPSGYTLTGTLIESRVDMSNPASIISWGRSFGYADNQLRGAPPYTTPDNPYTAEVEGCGGDAFDINWAVDTSGNYVDLDAIHFVKVVSCNLANAGWLGEISTEITGAARVEPNVGIAGELEMVVVKPLPDTIRGSGTYRPEVLVFKGGRLQAGAQVVWESSLGGAGLNADGMLVYSQDGALTLTAKLPHKPHVQASVSAVLAGATSIQANSHVSIGLYPNPTSGEVHIKCAHAHVMVDVFTMQGKKVYCAMPNQRSFNIGFLPRGCYMVRVETGAGSAMVKLIKY